MKTKSLLIFVIIVLIIIGIFLFYPKFNAYLIKESKTIKIGTVLPLTGSGNFIGPQASAGMQIAIDEINSNGGINGKKVELIIEDSKSIQNEGISAYNKLII